MKLSDSDETELARLFFEKHRVPLSHVSLKFSKWNISIWDNDDISSIISNPRSVGRELDKLWSEINNTDKNTIVNPILSEFGSSAIKEPILYQKDIDNILTNLGMKNMGELSTADSIKTNTECNVGDNNTSEAISNIELGNQLASKVFDTDGDRMTVDQQERYAMAFFSSDFGGDVILKEAGIATGPTPPTDIQIVRVTFADKPVNAGQSMTIQITVTHKNGTQ